LTGELYGIKCLDMFNWRTVWDKVFSLTFHEKPKYIHVKKKEYIHNYVYKTSEILQSIPKQKHYFMTD
jgi:hypothetical protein